MPASSSSSSQSLAALAVEQFQLANAAFVEEDYDTALALFTQAVQADPSNADYFLKRSITHAKLERHENARDDAAAAILLAAGNSDVAAKAHLRRGIALFELGAKPEARIDFEEAKRLGSKDKALDGWLRKSEAFAAAAPAAAAAVAAAPQPTAAPVVAPSSAPSSSTAGGATAPFLSQSKIRHEWFQNENFVTVSIFIKNLKKEVVSIDYTPRSCSVNIKLPTADYMLNLDPLAHAIVPSESKYAVMSTKVEIKLKKEKVGIKWGALEGDEENLPAPSMTVATAAAPTYPSSSKKKHDWDALSRSVEEEKPEGEQALNALFQKIYKDASDDTRRAMMKSYVESNGTCLSTNWSEVGKGTVPTTPPEGMVAKKYT
ncbi:SGS-domain-containing protein [Zopfochytrium polystomum]|nr:SGS-domain-containing protein [Zopfochytrium polystomum]